MKKHEWLKYCMSDLHMFIEFIYNLIAQGYEKDFSSYNFNKVTSRFNLFLFQNGEDFK